jgi:hypothetical protein
MEKEFNIKGETKSDESKNKSNKCDVKKCDKPGCDPAASTKIAEQKDRKFRLECLQLAVHRAPSEHQAIMWAKRYWHFLKTGD